MDYPSITTADKTDYDQLIELWEASVRATHDFLTDTDISHYKLLIYDYYFDELELYCIREQAEILGFIGLKDDYIQMVFVAPKSMQKGIGRELMNFAMDKHRARKVDVNEQNTNAVRFYEKMGFSVIERSAMDAAGKAYPVLSMALGVGKSGSPRVRSPRCV